MRSPGNASEDVDRYIIKFVTSSTIELMTMGVENSGEEPSGKSEGFALQIFQSPRL